MFFGLAKDGKTNKIAMLFEKMRGNNPYPIKPNLDSFVASIQSIGRQMSLKTNSKQGFYRISVERILNDMKKSGVNLKKITKLIAKFVKMSCSFLKVFD